MGSKGSKNHRHGENIIPHDRPYTTSATEAGIISGASSIPGMSGIPSGQISTNVNYDPMIPGTMSTSMTGTMPGATMTTTMPGTISSMPGAVSQMNDIIPGATIQTEPLPYTTLSGQNINTNFR
jgi:hypothetical protein